MIRTTTMERSNTHPITHEQQTTKKAGSIDWNAVITSLQQTINKYYPNSSAGKYWTLCEECFKKDQEDEEEEDEDDWEDITHCSRSRRHCHLKYTKKNNIVSTKLQMAGGGSHAWWYVLNWNNPENEPDVYIKTLNELTHTQKTLILRFDKRDRCESVKLVEFDSELPEEDDEDNEDEIKDYICDKLLDDPNFVS